MTKEEKISKLIEEFKLLESKLFDIHKEILKELYPQTEPKPLNQDEVEKNLLKAMERGKNYIYPIYSPSKYLTKALGSF
jgi:hypothetical protein